MKLFINTLLHKFGYRIESTKKEFHIPHDMKRGNFEMNYESTKQYSKTNVERMYAVRNAVEYVLREHIDGAIVECGVAAGGIMMHIAKTLIEHEVQNRPLYLYDTFEGMPKPGEKDTSIKSHTPQVIRWEESQRDGYNEWCYASLEEVRTHMNQTHYPQALIHYVKGMVEDTIPKNIPEKISILRLDTDWYASTKHELEYLYPLLSVGGVLLVDDYGTFEGAREAVDEYFSHHRRPLLVRVDSSGSVMGIKQ